MDKRVRISAPILCTWKALKCRRNLAFSNFYNDFLIYYNIKIHYICSTSYLVHPPFNIQKEKSRKISKSRSRNHSHEFTPVVAPSSTHSPSFVTCLEYGDGGVSMKILRYFVISPLVYNTLWVSVSEWVYIYMYVYTGWPDLRVRPSAPSPKRIPVVVRFPKFFRTVKFSQINEV